MARSLGRYDLVSHVDSDYLQMFLWEPFRALAHKPVRYSAIVPSEIRHSDREEECLQLVGRREVIEWQIPGHGHKQGGEF